MARKGYIIMQTTVTPIPATPEKRAPEYVSPYEAADILGVHHSTIRRQINAGKLTAYKIGTAIRIPRAALADILEPAAPWTVSNHG